MQLFLLFLLASVNAIAAQEELMSILVQDIHGNTYPLKHYAAPVLMIVNVASACGYTDSHYRELQMLYDKYHQHGLEILAFPCNQFGAQEPNEEPQILHFVQTQYQITFPMMQKINVNEPNVHPLYQYLKKMLPGLLNTEGIKWNFTKFLIKQGTPWRRYSALTSPEAMEQEIRQALGVKDHEEL